ncbi:hypothetical protein IJ425_02835 [bacterium]|nr:hypothetical protein [bacterium]
MGEYLGMRLNSLKLKRFFIAFTLFLAIATPAFAASNVISSVTISKAKHGMGGYELNIDSSQVVQYKSHIDSEGNVYFDLKNSTLAAGLGTIYDDVSDIDNVSIQQLSNNRVRIYVNGKDARDTELVFLNSLFDTSKESAKKVVINRPISEYKSTTYHNTDLEFQDDIQEWDDNSFNFSHLTTTVLSELKNGAAGKVAIFVLLFGILCMIIKVIATKLTQDREPLIGLNSPKALDNSYKIGTNTIKIQKPIMQEQKVSSDRERALKLAQAELSKAHQKYQQYIQNKYQGSYKPKSVDVDAIRKSIGINQYQKSTQNPYKNQEVLKMNKGFTSDIQANGNYQIPPRPKMQLKREFTSPYIQRKNNFVKTENKSDSPKTNMKFLESVTKIYERSGRGDLADGLKNSITKAKQTI